MRKVTPFLWFNNQAEEAMNFYVSIFKNSRIVGFNRVGDGSVSGGTFQLDGLEIIALNGGPQFTFSPAISMYVTCETQEEVDELWEKLSAGGEKIQCGWLKDKYGLSWQVIPSVLTQMLGDKDREKATRVMKAMLKMTKIEIAELQRAYDEK
jgi:predicted 3-demethylubiquinone-9 3-methyltransferase (glyoxalase superfamily)